MAGRLTIFLDASALIYWLEGDEGTYHAFARTMSALATDDKHPALASSVLSQTECLVRPLRNDDHTLVQRYCQMFDHPEMMVVPITPGIAREAARLRASYRLRTPDALQAACSLALDGPVAFVTGDRDFSVIEGLAVHRIQL